MNLKNKWYIWFFVVFCNFGLSFSSDSAQGELKIKKKLPFVTHCLVVLPEEKSFDNPTERVLAFCFAARNIILFSSAILKGSVDFSKKCEKYHFFGLSKLLDYSDGQFILGIPEEMLGDAFKEERKLNISNENKSVISPTDLEKKLGILIHSLQYLGNFDELIIKVKEVQSLPLSTNTMTQRLLSLLKIFFTPKWCYENKKDIPRWLLIFDGHGIEDYLLDEDAQKIVITKLFLSDILNEIVPDIQLMMVHISSCFTGKLKLEKLIQELNSCQFILTSSSFTNNGFLRLAYSKGIYKRLFDGMSGVSIKKKHIDSFNKKFCNELFSTYTEVMQNIVYNNYESSGSVGHLIPLFKSPLDEKFLPVWHFGSFCVLKNEDFITPRVMKNKKNSNFLNKGIVVLLDGKTIESSVNVVNFIDDFDSNSVVASPRFTAGISKKFFQTIKEIKVPDTFDSCESVLNNLFLDFGKKGFEGRYFVYVEKIKGIKNIVRAKMCAEIADKYMSQGYFSYRKNSKTGPKHYMCFSEDVVKEITKEEFKKFYKTFMSNMARCVCSEEL